MSQNHLLHVINLGPDQPVDPYASPDVAKAIIRCREERALSIIKQAKRYVFNVRFWEGVIDDHVFRSRNIKKAFKRIVSYAREYRLPRITIAEDDMLLTSVKAWGYYWEHIPSDYDVYLGGIYSGRIVDNRIVDGYSGNTLITVHERFYDDFLAADGDDHLDRALGQLVSKFKFIVCQPFAVKQLPGYSENKKTMITDEYQMYEKDWEYLT